MFTRYSGKRSLGFTLIELAIVLGVVGIMSAGLWRLMASGSQQTKDQLTAQQHLALINSVTAYLADAGGGQGLMTEMASNGVYTFKLPTSNISVADCQAHIIQPFTTNVATLNLISVNTYVQDFCNYIPTGMTANTTNPYGQTYQIQILKDSSNAGTAPSSYSFMIVTSIGTGTKIPDTDGGRISSLIGGDGGFIYTSTSICPLLAPLASPTACGAMGAWSVNTSSYAVPVAAAGTVASRTFIAPNTNTSMLWLARELMMGDSTTYTYNTMTTDMFLGTYQAANPSTTLSGSTTAPAIHLQYGYIDGSGTNATLPQINLSVPLANAPTSTTVVPAALAYFNSACTSTNNGYINSSVFPANPLSLIYCSPAVSVGGDISVTGEVTAKKLYSSSDARLKTDILPIRDALADLMKIDPVSFTFKAGGSKGMGVTAQNLEKVYPELVSLGGDGYKAVEYNGLIGPLIGAVQELKRQNDILRKQLMDDETRLNRVEKVTHP
jgi:prepilin-type N-terminal cleavage/methylation domain-containing protein